MDARTGVVGGRRGAGAPRAGKQQRRTDAPPLPIRSMSPVASPDCRANRAPPCRSFPGPPLRRLGAVAAFFPGRRCAASALWRPFFRAAIAPRRRYDGFLVAPPRRCGGLFSGPPLRRLGAVAALVSSFSRPFFVCCASFFVCCVCPFYGLISSVLCVCVSITGDFCSRPRTVGGVFTAPRLWRLAGIAARPIRRRCAATAGVGGVWV